MTMTQTAPTAPEVGQAPITARTAVGATVAEALVLSTRCLRHLTRSPEQLMLMLFLPAMQLLLFRYLLGGAIDAGGTAYSTYVVPGIVTVVIAFNVTSTSVAVSEDMHSGVVERFRSMPMHGVTILVGHVAAAVFRHLVSIAVVFGVGLLIGFRPTAGPGEWLTTLGLLVVFATAMSWIAALIGLMAKTIEGASGLILPLVFVPYLGSALVPPSTMPDGLRWFAENQPMSLVADATRAWLAGEPAGDTGWLALAWWVAITVVVVPLAAWVFRRKVAR